MVTVTGDILLPTVTSKDCMSRVESYLTTWYGSSTIITIRENDVLKVKVMRADVELLPRFKNDESPC